MMRLVVDVVNEDEFVMVPVVVVVVDWKMVEQAQQRHPSKI
jgi:hypothetical protein